MRRLVRLDIAQRIVAVVALAGLLRTLGAYVVDQIRGPLDGGWFAYAPLTDARFLDRRLPYGSWRTVVVTLVWLALIAAWAAVSIWLLGLPHARDTDAGPD